MINPPGDNLDELREFLFILAERLTRTPVEKAEGKQIKSTEKGLQVTAIIGLDKFIGRYTEKQIDSLLTELESEFHPDLGVSRTETSIHVSRFITEGGPWVEEFMPGVRFIYEVGKKIVSQVDPAIVAKMKHRQADGTFLIEDAGGTNKDKPDGTSLSEDVTITKVNLPDYGKPDEGKQS